MIGTYATIARVKYNDACGTVAADFADHMLGFEGVTALAVAKGFDDEVFFPYAIKFVFGEPFGGPTRRLAWLEILAVKKGEVGATMESVIAYINDHERSAPTYRFTFELNPIDFFSMFKRFAIDIGYQSKCVHNYDHTSVEKIIEEKRL